MTTASACDATTGWAGGISQFALETGGINIEGTGSLCAWIDATTSAVEYYTITSTDLSGDHIYIWMFCSGKVDTKANGGFRIVLYTDASNYATFYVGGNDTHKAQWNLMVCDPNATADAETGTFDPTDVTRIGVQFKTLTDAIKKGNTYVQNCFWDAVRYGTGFTITSGATDAIDFQDIVDWDEGATTRWFGVLQKSFGAYVLNGNLIFGDSASTGSVDFIDKNQVLLCPDNDKASDTFYGIEVVGNSTGTTNFVMGEASGSAGISGCLLKAAGAQPLTFTATDTDIDKLQLYGTSFISAGTVSLPATGANNALASCNFEACAQVLPSSCEIRNTNFIDTSDVDAAMLWSSTADVEDCNFIGNTIGAAIEHTVVTASTYTGLTFSGNTYDILYSAAASSGELVIGATDSNPSTSEITNATGNSVTINNAVTITITVKDEEGTNIEDALVRIEADSGGALPALESVTITSATGTATVAHTAHGMATGDTAIIRGAVQQEYNGVFVITVTGVDAYTYTVTGTPASPATGTITSTAQIMNELTLSTGIASESFNYSAAQPIVGVIRKSSATPFYKQGTVSGSISSSGFSVTVTMVSDE